ncbi:hypothetical protein Mgra_00009255 [Meloidogyne graminicola]|uniref:non-specific serine/threonine protein kinase n=1 Tax=Meloidogyne graminicola TaxID=189291 RepID=A0A8S9ZDH5_9BILA|nr:hypothetical protein Mgra_00009255 [Meloidogyne graminicola]
MLIENPQYSPIKSVQGMWTPSTWQDSAQNLYSCDLLPQNFQHNSFKRICYNFGLKLGTIIKNMHSNGLIHGDLTTSNVLRTRWSNGDASSFRNLMCDANVGMDFLMIKALQAYNEGAKDVENVLSRLDEVRMRGRKRDMIG